MIVSAKRVLELNPIWNLVENIAESQISLEGVGIDVRVGEVFRLEGDSYLGVDLRKTPSPKLVARWKEDTEVVMKSNDFVLVKTIEVVNIPSEKIAVQEGSAATLLMLNVFPRTTLQRCGVSFLGTKTDPGYKGQLIFGLKNVGGNEFRLELGARIANLVFEQVVGDLARPYEGPWSGGRVGTEGTEKQR